MDLVRLIAVIPFVNGDAIKANLCRTFPASLARGEGGAELVRISASVGREIVSRRILLEEGDFRSLRVGTRRDAVALDGSVDGMKTSRVG